MTTKHLNSMKCFQNIVNHLQVNDSHFENSEVGKINKKGNVTKIHKFTFLRKGAANVLFVLLLFSMVLLSGCLTDFNNWFGELTSKPSSEQIQTITTGVPVHMYDAEKIIYYHCSDQNYNYCILGMEKFMSFTENFLRCSFTAFEDEHTAQHLKELFDADVSVNVLLDKKMSFDVGLPREESQYLFLLRNLIDVQTSDVYENFCVSDRGVLVGSFFPAKDKLQKESTFMVIYSTDLAELYNKKYFEKFENK